MLSKPSQCRDCLGFKWDDRDGFIRPEGTGRFGVHIVGEAAGKNEAVDGLPFRPYAQAGSILTQCIKRAEAGLDRSDFLIHNILSCKPPGDLLSGQWFEQQVIEKCAIHRNATFRKHPPKAILALGATAFKTLTGYSGEEKETLSMMRGYPLQVKLLGRNVWVVPSFHPAYIARGKRSLIPVLIHDIRRALDVARSGWKIEKKDYVLYPSIGDAKNFLQQVIAQPSAMLSFDLENPEMHDDSEDWKDDEEHAEDEHWEELKQDKEAAQVKAFSSGKHYADIKTIQFSLRSGTGICLPWVGDYINFAKVILALPNPKIGQNVYRYDMPVLRDKGVPVNGRIHDLMWMMHHLWPDLEGCYHLQGICSFHGGDEPWKHKATTNPEYYGCEDVSNPLKALPTITAEMKRAGVWHSYERHIVDLVKVLDRASLKGIGFDTEGSKVLSGELGEEMALLVKRMRELCPDEVRLSKQKEGYAKEPKNTEEMVQRDFSILSKTYSEYKVDCVCVNGLTKSGKVCGRCGGSQRRVKRVLEKSKGKQKGTYSVVTRWCTLKPFVPSNKQLIRYMEAKGHSVPKHARTSKPTTDERGMDLLIKRTNDPMYALVKEYKGVQKLKSSYVDSWKTWNDGRIHTTFGFHPSTGQLNARDPNIQQLPKHKDIADRFRSLVIAPRSKWLVEMDYHSFHGMTCGFEAEDEDYLRMARIDLHSYLAASMVGKPANAQWDDKKLGEYLAWIKKEFASVRDTKAKRAGLGYQFGMTGYLLWMMNREVYEKQKDAEAAIAHIDSLYPKQVAYRNQTVDEAYLRKHLKTRYGYIRWFWDAKKYNPSKKTYVWSDDAKKAIAYRPANDAHGMMKEKMLELERRDLNTKCGFLMPYHDALIFEMDSKGLDKNIIEVQEVMETPDKVLVNHLCPGGLQVNVDVKIGTNLGKEAMKKWQQVRESECFSPKKKPK